MSQEKIARKKLLQEPDEFLSLSQRAWLWVHENQKKTGIILGGAVAALLLGLGVRSYLEHSRSQRADAVAVAVSRYTQASGGEIPADLRQELEKLAERYAGSVEGSVARYFQAGALAAAGEGEKARQIYSSLASQGAANGDLAVLSKVALAYLDLARGTDDAALPALEELLKSQGSAVPRAQIRMEIASIHEKKGRAAEARRAYQGVVDEHPDGPWVAPAKERLRLLAESGTSPS